MSIAIILTAGCLLGLISNLVGLFVALVIVGLACFVDLLATGAPNVVLTTLSALAALQCGYSLANVGLAYAVPTKWRGAA